MTPEQRTELGLDAEQLRGKILVALDPGANHPAVAIYDCNTLVIASRVPVPGRLSKLETGERCRQVASLISGWVLRETLKLGRPPQALVYEKPKVYQRGKSKGDPADIIMLALIAGGAASALCLPTLSPEPREWIGNIPKADAGDPWASPRGKIIWARLRAEERGRVVATHDAVDAAGIGLHALRRLLGAY